MPTNGATIRPYDPDQDQTALEECFIALQDHEHDFAPDQPTGVELVQQYVPRMLERCGTPGSALFVAEVDGSVAGFATAIIKPTDEPRDPDPLYCELCELGVRPRHRGRGLGEALIAQVEQHARDLGAPSLRVRVSARNDGARRLYRRLGLTPSIVVLSKRLGDGEPDERALEDESIEVGDDP